MTVIKRREPTSLQHNPIDIDSITAAQSLTFDLQNPSQMEMKDRICLPMGPETSAIQRLQHAWKPSFLGPAPTQAHCRMFFSCKAATVSISPEGPCLEMSKPTSGEQASVPLTAGWGWLWQPHLTLRAHAMGFRELGAQAPPNSLFLLRQLWGHRLGPL